MKSEFGLERILDVVPVLIWTARDDGSIDYVNARWTDYSGLPPEESLGWNWLGAVHPEDLERTTDVWEAAIAARNVLELQTRFRRSDGAYRWHLVRALPVEIAGEQRWIGSSFDIERQKRIEQTLQFLARANEVLAESLDIRATLERLADLSVPDIADSCAVHLNDNGRPVLASMKNVAAEQLDPHRAREVLLTGKQSARSDVAVFPMIVAERTVGTLSLAMGTSGRTFGELDLQFAALLASRAAMAVANSALFEREHHATEVLQRALLPAALPKIEGLRFEACYVAAEATRNIGGDWYDAFELDERRVLLSIGDVTGKGLAAATTMGRVRDSLRAAALCNDDPARILEVADDALRDENFVTCFAGILDRQTHRLRYVCAGHHPPRLRRADRTVSELPARGLPLGLRWAHPPSRPVGAVTLEPASLLVLFTDGLIEQTRDPVGELARLEEIVARLPLGGEAVALRDAFVVPPSRDDVALLTLYVEPR